MRVWGEVQQLQDNANVNIHEAWASLSLTEQVLFKFGRQELVYDDQRLLGSVNWVQQGRSHDALLFKYENTDSGFRFDAGGAYNQEGENVFGTTYSLNNYKFLGYLWANKQFGALNASAIFLSDGFQVRPNTTNFRYTFGTHLQYQKDNIKLTGSTYYQSGDDLNRRNIDAYMIAGNASYQFNALSLTGGYDYLSGGDANDSNPDQYAFNTLYATNHKFYGNMDYFLNFPADTRGGGLQDAYIGATYKWSPKTTSNLTYHYFALAGNIFDDSSPSDRYLGSELDFSLTYKFVDDVNIKVGYSTLFNSSSLENLQGRNAEGNQHWGWLMVHFQPTFFTSNN